MESPQDYEIFSLPKSTTQPSTKQEIFLSFDEATKELSTFLQSDDENEKNELTKFLSQVNQLHNPVIDRVSAISIFNYLQHMLQESTHISEIVSQVTVPDKLPIYSGQIATEIACNVIKGVDLDNITISVLEVLKELPWETKAVLMLTTFVLTFGARGLNTSAESRVSINDISMFAKMRRGHEHQSESNNDNLFRVVFKLVASIVKFERLPTTLMTSKDPKVKVARTNFVVSIYWIIRLIVAASTTHILKTSSRGYEFKTTISTLWKLHSRWSKNLEVMSNSGYFETTFSELQDLLKEEVDMEAYNRMKKIIKEGNHIDNLEVLNVLVSNNDEVLPLYDCLRRTKVDLNELKDEYVLLFISELKNIAPEVDKTKLNSFIHSIDSKRENQIECKMVWIPLIEHSQQIMEATQTSMVKPFLEWYYMVHYTELLKSGNEERDFKGWYYVGDPLMISNEVKKLFKDELNYTGKPIIVVLDPKGSIVHLNAIHMFYSFGDLAFPFTREREKDICKDFSIYDNRKTILKPIALGVGGLHQDWIERRELIFYYGGEDIEWIRSVTRMVGEISGELGETINMVYVGRNEKDDSVRRSVNEEKLSHCLSDPILLWLFWKRLHSYVYSAVNAGKADSFECRWFHLWLDWDKSNVGWALLFKEGSIIGYYHGKVVLHTLKEFKLWKENALKAGFVNGFRDHYFELYKKILPCYRFEYPTDALNEAPETMECPWPFCKRRMEKYTTFVCYHGRR